MALPTLTLEPRLESSRVMRICAPLIAAILILVSAVILFGALGHDPLVALHTFFLRPLSTVYGLGEWILKAAPLLLCALGLSIGFRGNVWNIGAEGQLIMGAVAGSALALAFHGDEGVWLLPAMLAAGVLGGMAWSAIPALFKTRFNANEILTSLMLTYVAVHFLGFLVHGPLRDPVGFGFPQSRLFSPEAMLPQMTSGTRIHAGLLLAPVAIVAVWLFVSRAFGGFRVDVVGQAPGAASYAGFSRNRTVWLGFLVAGGMAGLAGIMEVAGAIGQLQPAISPGYGFAAIIVAFLGRLHPLGIVAASLLMSLLYLGGEALQIHLNLPLAVTGVFQGLLLFYVLGSDVLVRYRIRLVRPAKEVSG